MSEATAPASAHTAPPAPPAAPEAPLRRVRRIGYAVLGLQLAGSLAWSAILYRRFALTFDFSIFHQAWFLISHGDLNPYNTVKGSSFWQDHSTFLLWPLALLYWIWPHGVLLLWLQDVCVVGAEAVAFTWLCEQAQRYRPGTDAAWLSGAGLILLVVNPWTWWTLSWDFHIEALAIPFTALLAWDLANGRRRAWIWVAPLLACGDVAATYLAGIGLGAVFAGRRARRQGTVLVCLGVAATVLITLVHGNLGSGAGLTAYDYLAAPAPDAPLGLSGLAKGIVSHPQLMVQALWSKRVGIWANLAPTGLLGIGFVWLLPVAAIVVLANTLFDGQLFADPGFQSVPLYVLLPVGTVAVLGWLARRHRRVALLLTGLVVAQAVAWSAVWLPGTSSRWLRVSAPAAATLAGVEARIPGTAEVFASQGIMGRFADRTDIQALFGPGSLSLNGKQAWFVIAPLAGIETLSTASAMALVGELAGPIHATLVTHANDVWAFRWNPPPGVDTITVPGNSSPLPAWAAAGVAGRAVMIGPTIGWHVTSTGASGYITDGLAWSEPPGRYDAQVTLSATEPVNVEVWNDTSNTLLARQTITATTGIQTVTLPVDAAADAGVSTTSGWGPFRDLFVPPPSGQRLEVRVWSAGGDLVNVYSAELTSATTDPAQP
jgi:Predicted membrane protein (DUF2079)